MSEQPGLGFAELLRQLRAEAGLTQEELAEAAGLSPRSVSDLERGIHRTAHKDTAGPASRCARPGRAGAQAVRGGGARTRASRRRAGGQGWRAGGVRGRGDPGAAA